MNLLLLEPAELDGSLVTLHGRRHRHLCSVLGARPGMRVRVGLLDGPLGEGEVLSCETAMTVLRCCFAAQAPAPGQDTLLLAVPRPKVLLRCLEHAAALGFGRILLLRTWRVDKSHLQSQAMDPRRQRARLCAGLEQARRTRLPEIRAFALFKPFVEDQLHDAVPAGNRFVAHPDSALPVHRAAVARAPFTLAIGPEGGFIPYEIAALLAQDFVAVSAGPHPLRVETALAALHAQVSLLRELGS